MEITPNEDKIEKYPEFHPRLMESRVSCGLSQKRMAELLDYESSTAISLLESGKRGISARKLYEWSHYTNRPIQYFFT